MSKTEVSTAKLIHTLIQGDVLAALRSLPSDHVDCIVTSPPYWGLRDYKIPASDWGDWQGQLGLEPDFRLYIKHILKVTKELQRVLKPTGCFFMNLGDTYSSHRASPYSELSPKYQSEVELHRDAVLGYPEKSLCFIPYRIALGMIDEQNWILRNVNVWHKPNAMPSSVRDRFSNRWEPMFFFVKEPRYYFDLDAVRVPHKYPTDDIRRILQDAKDGIQPFAKGDENMAWRRDLKESQRTPGIVPERFLDYSSKRNLHPEEFLQQAVEPEKKEEEKHDGLISSAQLPGRTKHSGYYSEDGELPVNPLGKNLGDVWEICTQPHPFAHFAIYPGPLVELPIKATCPQEICNQCGVAKLTKKSGGKQGFNIRVRDVKEGRIKGPDRIASDLEVENYDESNYIPEAKEVIIECSCSDKEYRPGIVLDPFAGSGTTGVVAKSLNRSSILIEINPEYVKIIKERMDWGQQTIDNSIEWRSRSLRKMKVEAGNTICGGCGEIGGGTTTVA